MTRKHDDEPETDELHRSMRLPTPDHELPEQPSGPGSTPGRPPHVDNALPPLRVGIGELPDVDYIEIPTQLPAGVRPYDFYHGGRRYEHHGEDADGTWLYRHNG
jgi:hypothetical protein